MKCLFRCRMYNTNSRLILHMSLKHLIIRQDNSYLPKDWLKILSKKENGKHRQVSCEY